MFVKELKRTIKTVVGIVMLLAIATLISSIIALNEITTLAKYENFEEVAGFDTKSIIPQDDGSYLIILKGKQAINHNKKTFLPYEGIIDADKLNEYKLYNDSDQPFDQPSIETSLVAFSKTPEAQKIIDNDLSIRYIYAPDWNQTASQLDSTYIFYLLLLLSVIVVASKPFTKDYDNQTNELFLTTKNGFSKKIITRFFSLLLAITIICFLFFILTIMINGFVFGFNSGSSSALLNYDFSLNLPFNTTLSCLAGFKFILLWLSALFLTNIVVIVSIILKSRFKTLIISLIAFFSTVFIETPWNSINNILFLFMPAQYVFSAKTEKAPFVILCLIPLAVIVFTFFTVWFALHNNKKEAKE